MKRYVAKLIKRYDADDNGSLNREEWQDMHGHPATIDGNTDGRITYNELLQHVVGYAARKRLGPPPLPRRSSAEEPSPQSASAGSATAQKSRAAKPFHVPANLLPASLPDWFRACDNNGDGQVSLAEYSPRVEAAEITEFNRLDGNRDGLVTAAELASGNIDQQQDASQTNTP